jgi:hypothetical protein
MVLSNGLSGLAMITRTIYLMALIGSLQTFLQVNINMYATLSQDMWMNAIANNSPTPPDTMVFTNDGGSIFQKNVTALDHVSGISVGPNNFGLLAPVFGSGNLIEPTTQYYEFHYERNGVVSSNKYIVN